MDPESHNSPNVEKLKEIKRHILHTYGQFSDMENDLLRLTFCQLAINFESNIIEMDYFPGLFDEAIDLYFRSFRREQNHHHAVFKENCKRKCLSLWRSASPNSMSHESHGGDRWLGLSDFVHLMHEMLEACTVRGDYELHLIRSIIVEHFGFIVMDRRFPVYVNYWRNEIMMVPMLDRPVLPNSGIPWATLLPQRVTPLELYRAMSEGNPLSALDGGLVGDRLISRLRSEITDTLRSALTKLYYRVQQTTPSLMPMLAETRADDKTLFARVHALVRDNVTNAKVMYTPPGIGGVTNVDVMRKLFHFIARICDMAEDYYQVEIAAGIIARIASPHDGPLILERILYDFIPNAVCDATRTMFDRAAASDKSRLEQFQRQFLGECLAYYYHAVDGPMHPAFNFKFYIYNSITHRDFANNPAMWTDVVDVFLETHRTIVDVPDVDNVHLIQSQSDLDSALRAFGHQQVGNHAPCWWHNVDVFNRDALLRHCQDPKHQQDPECRGRIRADDNGRSLNASGSRGYLKESMDAFAHEVRQYCDEYRKTNPAFVLRIPTGYELNDLINAALRQKTRACSRALIPSHPDFVTADRRLTYCEFAAIYFFTSVEGPGSFSLYTLLRSSMNYQTVRTMTGQEYVGRISHGLVTVFFSALYKCPRVYEIFWRGLVPDRSRFLHRFITVPSEVFVTYTENVVGSRMTFYCFQSFSLNLSSANIQQFLNISGQNTHVILLRIVINHRTTARYMSHLSEIETENEVLALPCVPYSVLSVDQPRNNAEFADYIRTQSGFDCGSHGVIIPPARGYLIVTLEEKNYMETMNPVNPAKPHAG